MSSWTPTTISFSSGGAKGGSNIGVLARLIEEGKTVNVRSWYGCSAGSFCAYLGALGVSPAWMRDCIQHFDMRPMLAIDKDLVMNFMETWGFASGKELIEMLGNFVDTWEPGASTWTFATLKSKGHFLGITAVNLNKRELELFSVDTHPNMLILDAIRASCTIPFIFTPWRSPSGDLYCDGAILEQCPWFHIPQKKETLVIACDKSQIFGPAKKCSIETFMEYCMRVLIVKRPRLCKEKPRAWIAVCSNVSSMNFDITVEERLTLFQAGEAAATAWLRLFHGENPRTQHEYEVQNASLGFHRISEESMSDNHQQQNPLQPRVPFRDLHRHSGPSSRRWSV